MWSSSSTSNCKPPGTLPNHFTLFLIYSFRPAFGLVLYKFHYSFYRCDASLIMNFHTIIVSLLVASTTAVPTTGSPHTGSNSDSDATASDTTKSKYMTLEECEPLYDATKAKKTLFWSGCGNEKAKAAIADTTNRPYLAGYDVMREIFKRKWSANYDEYIAKFAKESASVQADADDSFWNTCSQALAELAEGEIYVLMPGKDDSSGLDWGSRANSHWSKHEYPVLCKKKDVTKLYRLSAADPKVKEDLTDKMLKQRKDGTCPALEKKAIGGEAAS